MTAPPRFPRILTFLLPALVLLGAPALLLWSVVFLHEVFLPADLLRDIAPWRDPAHPVPWNPLMWDGMAEFYPWRLFYARTLHQGMLPLWNPHQFCGTPFLANVQSAVLYPLNLLFAWLPVPQAFGASVWLHLSLTGLFLYGFLRSDAVKTSRPAAVLGAITWQLSTWQTAWLALPTFLCVSTWLPLALWLTSRLITRPSLGRATALGAVLGIFVLAGHLQIALYCVGLTLAYALFLIVRAVQQDKTQTKPLLWSVGIALAVMAGIAAPQLLPSLELSHLSHRSGVPLTKSSYDSYIKLAVSPVELLTLYHPQIFGSPTDGTFWGDPTNGGPGAYMENACYVGVLALLLGIAGVTAAWRRHPAARFFSVIALLALLMALGTPLNALPFFLLPGFAQSGSPGRILVLWTFCAAVLAAIGTDTLLTMTRRQGAATLSAFVAFLLILVGYTVFWITRNAPAGTLQLGLARDTDLWRLPLGILLGAGIFYVLWQRETFSRRVFQGSLVALATADLLAANVGFNRTAQPQAVYPVTPGIAFLQQHAGNDRVIPLNQHWGLYQPPPALLPPNTAMVYGLYDTQGYDSLLTKRAMTWAAQMDTASPAPPENGNMVFTYGYGSLEAREAAARYIVSPAPLPDAADLTLALHDGEMWIYENRSALPHVRSSNGTTKIESMETRLPTRLTFSYESPVPDTIVIADQWYPGWRMRSSAEAWKSVPVSRGFFRNIVVQRNPGQQERLEMRYEPTTFRLGCYGLCVTLSVLAGTAFGNNSLRRRRGAG